MSGGAFQGRRLTRETRIGAPDAEAIVTERVAKLTTQVIECFIPRDTNCFCLAQFVVLLVVIQAG